MRSRLLKSALIIRRAVFADRNQLTAMFDLAFSRQTDGDNWFATHLSHLFTAQRIVKHTVMIEDGHILGCVGCYNFPATLRGHPLTAAGIGQVATAPAARSRGLMTQMMNSALDATATADLFFLYGDRARYGRFGFAPGGEAFHATTWDRYAPAADPGAPIRAVDLAADAALIEAALSAQPFVMQQQSAKRLTMLRGKFFRG